MEVVLFWRLDASFRSYGLDDLKHVKNCGNPGGPINLILWKKVTKSAFSYNYHTSYTLDLLYKIRAQVDNPQPNYWAIFIKKTQILSYNCLYKDKFLEFSNFTR